VKPEIAFNPPPRKLEPPSGEVHVFCTSLDQPWERMERLVDTLSEEELHRAGRFRFKKDLDRFVTGRGILREILGCMLDVKPEEVRFSYGSNGKPRLAMSPGNSFSAFQRGTFRFVGSLCHLV